MTKKFFELEEKKGLVNTSKWSPKNTPYAYSFDAYKAIWDDARASKAFERANLSTKEIKDIYKSWKITKQDVQDIIYAKQQNAQSQYIYERGIKRTVDRGWKNENDIILSLKNMITDDKPSIWEKLDSLKANKELQPLYEEARKYKSADEFARSLKYKDDMKAKILMDWFNEKYKSRTFEDMAQWIEYTKDQKDYLLSIVEPNMKLSLEDAKSLINNDKWILSKINKKMWINLSRSKEKWEIFEAQLRKIREEANR